ncbi:MAG: DUF4265 domain-containing protein [Phycisphaerae bacterium]|nr:DUF4265 domain-containing protein [Phycisphaerae bacterium]
MHQPPEPGLFEIHFPIDREDDGAAVSNFEPLWASRNDDGTYSLRNTPFFVSGYARLDVIEATELDGRLIFKRLIRPSGRSTIRVTFEDVSRITGMLSDMERMGCFREFHAADKVYAFDIPLSSDLRAVVTYLSVGEENGWWSVDHACVFR